MKFLDHLKRHDSAQMLGVPGDIFRPQGAKTKPVLTVTDVLNLLPMHRVTRLTVNQTENLQAFTIEVDLGQATMFLDQSAGIPVWPPVAT